MQSCYEELLRESEEKLGRFLTSAETSFIQWISDRQEDHKTIEYAEPQK